MYVDVDIGYRCRLRYIPIIIITMKSNICTIFTYSHHISYSHYKPIDCHYIPM